LFFWSLIHAPFARCPPLMSRIFPDLQGQELRSLRLAHNLAL